LRGWGQLENQKPETRNCGSAAARQASQLIFLDVRLFLGSGLKKLETRNGTGVTFHDFGCATGMVLFPVIERLEQLELWNA
jgi:hypothetical protein